MCKRNNGRQEKEIKKGQIWRCKNKNYCIEVGNKLKDEFWGVYPHGKRTTVHKMRENSFHFYELIEEAD